MVINCPLHPPPQPQFTSSPNWWNVNPLTSSPPPPPLHLFFHTLSLLLLLHPSLFLRLFPLLSVKSLSPSQFHFPPLPSFLHSVSHFPLSLSLNRLTNIEFRILLQLGPNTVSHIVRFSPLPPSGYTYLASTIDLWPAPLVILSLYVIGEQSSIIPLMSYVLTSFTLHTVFNDYELFTFT